MLSQGINRGVVFFRPNREEARAMLLEFETYSSPDFVGDEQEFLMKYFGLEQQIASLDLAMNYQVHHFEPRAAHDSDASPWISLAQLSDQAHCFYFSAVPRPSNLLLGDINEESCGSLWGSFKDFGE